MGDECKKHTTEEKKRDVSTGQAAKPTANASMRVKRRERRDTKVEQKGTERDESNEPHEQPNSSGRRKRGSRGKAKGVPQAGARSGDTNSTDPNSQRSTKTPASNSRRKDGERKSICRFLVDIAEDSDFQVCRRL